MHWVEIVKLNEDLTVESESLARGHEAEAGQEDGRGRAGAR